MANKIEGYVPPPALPVVPVQPLPAPETPPDNQTGASSARLALVASGAAASAPAFDARSAGNGATPVFSADPSVETFADDYLNASWDVAPETGRSDNVGALFSRSNAGRTSGAL